MKKPSLGLLKALIENISQKTRLDKKVLCIIALGLAGMLLLLSEMPFAQKSKEASEEETTTVLPVQEEDYAAQIEKDLTEIISSIKGAGTTRVMVTLESSGEVIYLSDRSYRSDKDSNSGISSNEENKYIIIDGENGENGIVAKTVEPKIRGVAVVCEGAGTASVKAEIVSAVTALLDISSARVSVSTLGK